MINQLLKRDVNQNVNISKISRPASFLKIIAKAQFAILALELTIMGQLLQYPLQRDTNHTD